MLLLAKTVLSGWWQGPLLISLLFQVPILQWCALALLALVTMRFGSVAGTLSLLTTAVVTGLFMVLVPKASLPLIGLISATVILAASQVLRYTSKPTWSWFVAASMLVTTFWAVDAFFPQLLVPYEEQARLVVDAWLSSLAIEDRNAVADSVDALIVQILVTLPLVLVCASLLLGRFWQSKLFNPGGFAQEFQASRVDVRLALASLALWLLLQFVGSSVLFGLAYVFLLPFMLAGLGLFHWLAQERHWGVGWYVAFYVLFIIMQLCVVFLAIMDSFLDLRWRLKRGIHGGTS